MYTVIGTVKSRAARVLWMLEELLELCERSETDDLLRVLGRRQTLLEAALASAKRLEPFLARWDEFMDALPQPERGALVERVRAIQQRVDRIATADEDDRRRLTAQRNDLTAELAGVGRSRGALAAYASPGSRSPNPRFQDRKG